MLHTYMMMYRSRLLSTGLLPNITRSLFTIRSGNTDIGNDSAEATVVMVPLKLGWNLQNGDCRDTHCTDGVDRG